MTRTWRLPDGLRVEQEGPEWRLFRRGRTAPLYVGDAEGLVSYCQRNLTIDLSMTDKEARKIRGEPT